MNELPKNPEEEREAIAGRVKELAFVIPLAVAKLDLMLASPSLEDRQRQKVRQICKYQKKNEVETVEALQKCEGYRNRVASRREFFVDVGQGIFPDNWHEVPSWSEVLPYLENFRDMTAKPAWAFRHFLEEEGGDQEVHEMIEKDLADDRPPDISDEEFEKITRGVADSVIEKYREN
ncbi:MAG: hypothetical protein NT039_01350 [Candidatus Berkelbacteria bacterium]|nr:hypothetical protein [Candidatus Berkelbacteria bacterium]